MGQDTIMNVHITGLDLRNEENYKSQVEVLNKIFPEKDEKNSTSDYTVKYSKKPKWKAFIYSDQNTTNFSFINKNIQAQINKYQKLQDKDKKEKNNKKEGLNNQMIIHFVSDNSDDLLLDEFNKDNSIDNLGENFPLILLRLLALLYRILPLSYLPYQEHALFVLFLFPYSCLIHIVSSNRRATLLLI